MAERFLTSGESRAGAAAAALALLMALARPMRAEDAVVLFNRNNHFSDESVFFHYAGYVAAAPQAISYAAQILPHWVQALIVMGAAAALFVATTVAFHRAAGGDWRATAIFLGGGYFMTPLHIVNLSYSIWTAAALAMILLHGATVRGGGLAVPGLAAVGIAGVSNPATVFLAPAFAVAAITGRSATLAIAAGLALIPPFLLREPGGATFSSPAEVLAFLGRAFGDLAVRLSRADPGFVLRAAPFALLILGAALGVVFLRRLRQGDRSAVGPLAILAAGGGALVFAMVSVRAATFSAAPPRYASLLFVACLLAALRLPVPRPMMTVLAAVAVALGLYRFGEDAARLPQGLALHAALIDPAQRGAVLVAPGGPEDLGVQEWALLRGVGATSIAACDEGPDREVSAQGVLSLVVRDREGRTTRVNCGGLR